MLGRAGYDAGVHGSDRGRYFRQGGIIWLLVRGEIKKGGGGAMNGWPGVDERTSLVPRAVLVTSVITSVLTVQCSAVQQYF